METQSEAKPPDRSPALAELAAAAKLSEAGRRLVENLGPASSADDAVSALERGGLPRDAVQLLARRLGSREAVWWSVVCLRRGVGQKARDDEAAALAAAESWVIDPSEASRRKAEAAAKAIEYRGPAALAAMAAFWSGANLAPEGVAEVPVPAGLTARGAVSAILLAASGGDAQQIPAVLGQFLEIGRAVVRGEHRWPENKVSSRG